MAIVINGSGTVTGLAVGGLPDGTVDAGTLATDSVTAAKLEVSAITGADLPAGSVLQIVSTKYASAVNISSTTFQNSGLGANITPSSTSSKILIMITASVGGDGYDSSYLYGAPFRDSTELMEVAFCRDQPVSNYGATSESLALTYLDSPSSTSQITYRLKGRATNANHQFRFNYVSGHSTITLMEIAG